MGGKVTRTQNLPPSGQSLGAMGEATHMNTCGTRAGFMRESLHPTPGLRWQLINKQL